MIRLQGSCGRLDLPDSNTDKMFESLTSLRAMEDRCTSGVRSEERGARGEGEG